MARTKKRLMIRLSIVAVITVLGTVALMQAQGVFSGQENESPQTKKDEVSHNDGKDNKDDGDTDDSENSDGKPSNSKPDDLSTPASFDDAPLPPRPPIIRANGDDETSGFKGSLDGGPSNSLPAQPPVQNSFDNSGSLHAIPNSSPMAAIPPTQPPIDSFVQPSPTAQTTPTTNLSPDQFDAKGVLPNALRPDGGGSLPTPNLQPNNEQQFAPVVNHPPVASVDFDGNDAPYQNQDPVPNNYPSTQLTVGDDAGYSGSSGSYLDPPTSSLSENTSSRPGPSQLEGTQTPALTLQKLAPAEIQVGRSALFQLKIKNVGRVDAHGVTVVDQIPDGTRFVDASPQATRDSTGALVWNLGEMKANSETTVSVQLIPLTEGEIGSVATVAFQSKASVKTVCTKPVLTVEHSGPDNVLIGQSVSFDIKVTNNGTGIAANVMLEEDVPEELVHPAGSELEYEIGNLQPGESRQLRLTLQAKKAGVIENVLLVRGEGNLLAEHRAPIEIIAPELKLGVSGPGKRYLERQATYTVAVSNPGTAKATDVELVAHLPKGLKFINTNNHGQYDPQTHAVYWSLSELPARETGEVELTALPVEMGQQKLRIEGKANLGLAASQEKAVKVEGLAAIFFGVADTADPIEVGSDTVYQVTVVNQGSKTATDVRIIATLPPGLQPIGGDGPTTYRISGQNLVFDPLARLAPKGQAAFKIQARGTQEGDHRILVQVKTNEVSTPVSKEESTRVYVDR